MEEQATEQEKNERDAVDKLNKVGQHRLKR